MKRWIILLAATLLTGSAHAEQQCAMQKLASFDLKYLANGMPSIPVLIAGKEETMAVDVSNPYSFLYADYGDAEGFNPPMPNENWRGSANPSKELYEVPELVIGGTSGKDVVFVRMKGPRKLGNDVVGELASDMLSRFDVELDLKNNKMNLFSGQHCAGNVVYWTKSPYAVLTFKNDRIGHPYFLMDLDGKTIVVSMSLWPGPARMSMDTAKRIFDINENSFGVTQVASPSADDLRYRFPFKELNMNGMAIKNPKIDLSTKLKECRSDVTSYERNKPSRCFGGSDLYLGLEQMKQLHLFYAFSEGLLYVTSADAH